MGRFICLSILILPMLAEGQDRFADSLELVLATAPLDTNRVNLLNTLTFRLKYSDPERALRHADEAENLAKQLAYRKGLAATYYCRAYVTQIAGDYPRAVKLVQQSLDIARDDSDLYRQAYCHGLLGIIYGRWTDHDKAVRHNLLAGELFRLLGDTLTLAAIQTNIGTLYEERGVYDSALVHYFKSLEYKRAKGRHGAAVVELANIGASYRMLGEHELALDYNWQGIVQSMKSPERPILDHFYANRGEVYLDLGRLDSATHYAQAAYEIAKGRNQPYHRLPTLKLLGEVNLKTGKTNAATRFFQEGFTLAVDIGNLDYQAILGCELGGLYLAQGQVDEAIRVLEQVYRAGRAQNNYVHLECAAHRLADAYEQAGKLHLALHYLKQHHAYRDSLAGAEKRKHLLELERQYRTEAQARELAEKDLALARQQARSRAFAFEGLAVLLLFAGLAQYFRYRARLRRQQAEAQLEVERQQRRYLEELGRSRSNFFANISHEFRTPLTLILGPLIKAQEQAPLSEQEAFDNDNPEIALPARHVAMMRLNAERLGRLIDQLLDLSRLESGGMKLQVSEGDVVSFVRAMVFSFESLAERRRIHYQTEFPQAGQMVFFDKDKLEKIIVNLLSNAFKHTAEHGRIFVKTVLEKGRLKVSVRDSGPGIPSAELDKIFERFYQVEGAVGMGAGIGLSLVKELVEIYRGQISVESAEGQGTTFKFSLPAASQSFHANEIVDVLPDVSRFQPEWGDAIEDFLPAESKAALASAYSNLPLLLVVEDNPDLRRFITEIMRGEYQVLTAADGEAGLEIALEKIPDLILCDVMIPRMNGFDLCRNLKKDERTSHIPIILLTAKAGLEHKVEGLETGADDYLTKPFDEKELLARASNLVEQRNTLWKRYVGASGWPYLVDATPPRPVVVVSSDERFLRKVIDAIEENMDNEFFSVEDLANAAAFSRSQLHRKLKALTGKGPNELIRDFRLARAKELLEKGRGNVSEVAMAVGYSSVSYFTRSFKAAFGVLPSEV
jgi:signal transduction histidine kinase/DNA-binding response OmpR family regulator